MIKLHTTENKYKWVPCYIYLAIIFLYLYFQLPTQFPSISCSYTLLLRFPCYIYTCCLEQHSWTLFWMPLASKPPCLLAAKEVKFSQLSSNICCPRDFVSRHKGGTQGAPIMPRDAVSRTANVERNGGHKWVNGSSSYKPLRMVTDMIQLPEVWAC